MKSKSIIWMLHMILPILIISGCKKDDDDVNQPPPPVNDEEIITTFRLHLTDSAGVVPEQTVTFSDPDGIGGDPPVSFDTIILDSFTTYRGQIEIVNETTSPPTDITVEVEEEANDHIFCFNPENVDLTVKRRDIYNGMELGLETTWTAGNTGKGSTVIRLLHQPGTKDGSCDHGETDIELNFITIIR